LPIFLQADIGPSCLFLYRFWIVGWAIVFLLGLNPYVIREVQNDKNGPILLEGKLAILKKNP